MKYQLSQLDVLEVHKAQRCDSNCDRKLSLTIDRQFAKSLPELKVLVANGVDIEMRLPTPQKCDEMSIPLAKLGNLARL